MKIVLVGFMGSGKTTVGRILAERLRADFVDTDAIIEARTRMSIPEIFEKKGEEYFRSLERKTILELLDIPGNAVISAGGGLPAIRGLMEEINKRAITVYLKADFDVIWERISGSKDRPLVALGKERLRELLERREKFYRLSKFAVDTSSKTPGECAEEILNRILEFEPSEDSRDRGHKK